MVNRLHKAEKNGLYVQIVFNSGALVERIPGLAHFLEHMSFVGTNNYTEEQIDNIFQKNHIKYNAYTSNDSVGYWFSFDKTVQSQAEIVINEILNNAIFPQDKIERERGVILHELEMINSVPSNKANYMIWEAMFCGSQYGRKVIGTKESIKSITRNDIADYYKYLNDSNALMVTVGEKNPQIKFMVDDSKIAIEKDVIFDSELFIYDTMDTSNVEIRYGWPINKQKTNIKTLVMMEIVEDIFGNGTHGRLSKRIRKDLGLTYHISGYHTMERYVSSFVILTSTLPENKNKVQDEIEDMVEKMIDDGFTQEELDNAKHSNFLTSRLINDGATGIANTIKHRYLMGGEKLIDDYNNIVANATLDELNNAMREVFANRKPCIAILDPK